MKRWMICILAALVFCGALACQYLLVLRETPEGRVEVLFLENLDAAADTLRQEGQTWVISQEEDRLVVRSVGRFSAQAVDAVLSAKGMQAAAVDYAWASEVLAQSGWLWLAWAALLGLWLLWSLIGSQGRLEWDRAQAALEDQYLGAYLADAGVRLLAKGIGLAIGVIGTILLLQWLWRVPVALPTGLLPDSSIFDAAHCRLWMANTFPTGLCSGYGMELAAKLKLSHLLAAVECVALTVCVVMLRKHPSCPL